MSNRGRPSKTDSEKKARGTYKPSRSTGDERKEVLVIDPGKPKHNICPEAVEVWRNLCMMKIAYGGMTPSDMDMIDDAAYWYNIYITYADRSPVEINVTTGLYVVSAFFKVQKEAYQMYDSICNKLGILPSQRLRFVKPDAVSDSDPMKGLL